jgi:hypothetical protein
MGCPCVLVIYDIGGDFYEIDVPAVGTYNGRNYFMWASGGVTYYMFWNSSNGSWQVTEGGLNTTFPVVAFTEQDKICPPEEGWQSNGKFNKFYIKRCDAKVGECCISMQWCFNWDGQVVCTMLEVTKVGDGSYTFTWVRPDGEKIDYTIDYTGGEWMISDFKDNKWAFTGDFLCPSGEWIVSDEYGKLIESITTMEIECPIDRRCFNEDRINKSYEAVKLPKDNVEEDRGGEDCCCMELVLGGDSSNSWENDITPIWIKLGTLNGSATFILKKEGEPTYYPLQIKPVVREPNAFYAEVNWGEVINYDGAGCYSLEIEYNISGITGTVLWGHYELRPYSIQNAMYTARVRAVFNSFFFKENIDFTDTNMQGTLRFAGLIGKRQPNTEIDNIIYGNREMKSVVRENLNTYEITTDPLGECVLKPLIEIYLLHENQLFISDYNFHNHSYLYNDLPVILEESAEVTYYDWSRKASLVAKVGDKVKNNINNYK